MVLLSKTEKNDYLIDLYTTEKDYFEIYYYSSGFKQVQSTNDITQYDTFRINLNKSMFVEKTTENDKILNELGSFYIDIDEKSWHRNKLLPETMYSINVRGSIYDTDIEKENATTRLIESFFASFSNKKIDSIRKRVNRDFLNNINEFLKDTEFKVALPRDSYNPYLDNPKKLKDDILKEIHKEETLNIVGNDNINYGRISEIFYLDQNEKEKNCLIISPNFNINDYYYNKNIKSSYKTLIEDLKNVKLIQKMITNFIK